MPYFKKSALAPALKPFIILIGCLCGTGAVVMPSSGISGRFDFDSPVPYLAGILLAVVYAVAFRRGTQGRTSESWAILAWGSWVVFLWTMFGHVAWWQRAAPGEGAVMLLLFAAALGGVTVPGLRAAWCGDWERVAGWWVASLLVLFFLALQYNYAQYFAGQRAKAARSSPSP